MPRDSWTGWIRVEVPQSSQHVQAVFALRVEDGKVVDAAPIARKSIGRSEREVADYYRHLGATFSRVDA